MWLYLKNSKVKASVTLWKICKIIAESLWTLFRIHLKSWFSMSAFIFWNVGSGFAFTWHTRYRYLVPGLRSRSAQKWVLVMKHTGVRPSLYTALICPPRALFLLLLSHTLSLQHTSPNFHVGLPSHSSVPVDQWLSTGSSHLWLRLFSRY
jgi:hypothetical protein